MLRFADIFCGGGLGARGAIQAGCTPVLAVDIWDVATATYADNFPTARVITSSVQKLSPLACSPGRVDLLLASPECTNHSPAKGAAPRSESSRRTAFSVLVWAAALHPRWIIIENVLQFRNWRSYRALMAEFQALGYMSSETVVDSADFGVPQARRRLIITFERGNTPPGVVVPTRRARRNAAEILDARGTWSTTPLFSERRAKATLIRAAAAIEMLGSSTPFLIVYYGSDGGGGWQSLDEPLRTVTTLDRFALVEKIRGEYLMRMLQPQELARAMGVSAIHKFRYGTRRDKIKLCGNGVCAPVMEQVIRSVIPEKYRLTKMAA